MPTTHLSEAALECRRKKFQFLENFPGLLHQWKAAEGRIVRETLQFGDSRVLVFADGAFLIFSINELKGDSLLKILLGSRQTLEPFHGAAFLELDGWIEAEREAMRLARMEKVLGAVEQNLPQVPELRGELLRLLEHQQ